MCKVSSTNSGSAADVECMNDTDGNPSESIMRANSIIIRELREADIPGAMRLKTAENWNQTEADWRTLLKHDPDLCLAATHDGKIIGTVTATKYANELAWIGMMLVDKDFRGLGLGKRLLTTVIEKLGKCQSVKLDATATGLPLYHKLGFCEELGIDRMVTTDLEDNLQEADECSVRPLAERDWQEVMDLDRAFFGADRSRLIAEILRRNGDKGWVTERKGSLTGFLLGRSGSNYTQLGPLSAQTTEDAKSLLLSALRNYAGKPVLLDILQDKNNLKELLLSLGFAVQRSFTRMYLKENPFPGSIENQFLIAGPELG